MIELECKLKRRSGGITRKSYAPRQTDGFQRLSAYFSSIRKFQSTINSNDENQQELTENDEDCSRLIKIESSNHNPIDSLSKLIRSFTNPKEETERYGRK